jgi:putative nucleotidyltransferase with HDIG domain
MAKQKTLFEQLKREEAQELANPDSLRNSMPVKIGIISISVLICAMLFPNHTAMGDRDLQRGNDGMLWVNETIKAESPFAILRPAADVQKDIQYARDHAPAVFVQNPAAASAAKNLLNELLHLLEVQDIQNAGTLSGLLPESLRQELLRRDNQERKKLQSVLSREIPLLLQNIYESRGFMNVSAESVNRADEVVLRLSPVSEQIMPRSKPIDSVVFRKVCQQALSPFLNEKDAVFLQDILLRIISPNLVYSQYFSNLLRDSRAAAVPRTLGIVRAGEIVIAKGERIDRMALLKLQSYMNFRSTEDAGDHSWIIFLGSIGHSLLIFSMLVLYLYFIRPGIFQDNVQIAGLSGLMILTAFMGWLTVRIESSLPLEYAVFIPALSMLIAILFDSRTAFYSTVVMSLLIAGIRGSDYAVGLAMMIAGMLAAYSVRDIQSRTQIFQSILVVLLGFALTILSVSAERTLELKGMWISLVVAAVNSVISPLLTFAVLYVVERVFNLTTDLRLDEFDDTEHPLLKEMSEKAPGTYQHTLTIARLAESAATAIGANSLLAKTGAYFHDIGKIPKAEYFVENQINIDNKHDRLPARKSAAIIKEHIAEGVELAKEYKLPQRIVDFIPMHHGTMLIKHFYAKALEAAGEQLASVNEDDYRYDGPKPRTKETAIVMLADAAEAISRAATADDRDDIIQMLDGIIRERFLDGQFDECPLTMQEIQEIKESFARNLLGMRHHRVVYKEIPSVDKGA